MSSPFAYFRKRQKAMIVALGVMCMIAFIFLGMPLESLEGPSGANLTVATTKYGTIHETDMQLMIQSQNIVNEFLQQLAILTLTAFQEEGMDASVMPFIQQQLTQQLQNLLGSPSEEAVVDSMILAHKAEELGIVISDARINQYLRGLTLNKVTSDQIRNLLMRMDVSQGRIFEGLRTTLLAHEVRLLSLEPFLSTAPPGLRWDYYRRLNERLSIEAVPVEVSDFVGMVEEPSQTELQAFFEQYKDREALPSSPEPGFHQPERGKFQYFRADFETFLTQAAAAVTDEEVEAFYNENKQQFPKSELPREPVPDEPAPDEPAASDETPMSSDEAAPESAEPAEPASEEAPSEPAEPADTPAEPDDAAENETPEETPSSDETPSVPAEEEPADAEPSDEGSPAADSEPADEPNEDAPADEEPAAGDEESAALRNPAIGSYEFALVQDEADAPAEPAGPALGAPDEAPQSDEPATETPPADDEPAAEEQPESSPAADEAPASAEPETEMPAADEAEMAEETEEELDLTVPQSIDEAPEPAYEPLANVEDQIRRFLSSQRANELIAEKFVELTQKMNAFYDENYEAINAWRAAREEEDEKPPAVPTFDARAAAAPYEGISADETALLSAPEMQELTDLGRSTVAGNTPFVQMAFSGLRLFAPKQSQDVSGNQFLFWKIEEAKEFVPTLDEIRGQVIEAWKMRSARKLAAEKAEELAAEARSADKPLREVFGGRAGVEVIDTGTFTWMTFGSAGQFSRNQPPRLSAVRGIPEAGHDFMRQVFSLETGQVRLAFNAPETVVYVVRVASMEPSEVVLRETFMVDPFGAYRNAATGDIMQVRETWERHMREEAGLDWARMPHPADLR